MVLRVKATVLRPCVGRVTLSEAGKTGRKHWSFAAIKTYRCHQPRAWFFPVAAPFMLQSTPFRASLYGWPSTFLVYETLFLLSKH